MIVLCVPVETRFSRDRFWTSGVGVATTAKADARIAKVAVRCIVRDANGLGSLGGRATGEAEGDGWFCVAFYTTTLQP